MDHGATGAIHEIVHWLAAVVLVVGGAVVVGLAARARAAERTPVRALPRPLPAPAVTPDGDRSPLIILAGLSLGAAAIHLSAAPSHYVELGDLGAGFLVAAGLQAAWARAILGGASRRSIVAGLAINAAIVAAWGLTRTIGLPVGPDPFVAERIGLPDGASTAFELLLLAGLAALAVSGKRIPRTLVSIGAVPVLGLVILTTSFASLAIVAGAEHGAPPGGGIHAAMENSASR